MKRFVCFLMAFAILLGFSIPARAVDYSKIDTVRVGLYYGDDCAQGFNALAENGFLAGAYDGDAFYKLMDLDSTYLAVYADRAYSGDVVVRPYNIEAGPFVSSDEAWGFGQELSARMGGVHTFPAFTQGEYRSHIGSFSSEAEATSALAAYRAEMPGVDFRVSGEGGTTVIDLNYNKIVFETDKQLALKAVSRGDEAVYLKNGKTRYYGAFEFQYAGKLLRLVNVANLEDYVCGVVPNEMSASFANEALRVQAVCARGYAVMQKGKHKKEGFDVCDTIHCQVYRGRTNVNENVWQAVNGTRGEVVTYEGKPISTYFSASSGGYTESSQNAWGGKYLPYYSAVLDPYSPPLDYESRVSASELSDYLQDKGYKIGNIVDCYISQYTEPAGNAFEVTIVDSGGNKVVIKNTDKVRVAFTKYVKSPRFHITKSGGSDLYLTDGSKAEGQLSVISGGGAISNLKDSPSVICGDGSIKELSGGEIFFTFKGTGWGHNVGMSQYGAKEMAKQGFTYPEILGFYYKGTTIQKLQEL